MQTVRVGSDKYILSGGQLYHNTDAAADAALKSEWAKGILIEKNIWVAEIEPEIGQKLVEGARVIIGQAEQELAPFWVAEHKQGDDDQGVRVSLL
ncbi:hypothetical protein QAO71_17100 (plasmid) [Halopseudomonas sp. SMJS2]|uniref:hypothetical protein n=1 Tax=Halopseudomonas sp. SMJS2 TaxID=3041098 RepID=UPI002452CC3F|nr:hypothetical protein [Halopseudomonas sp. SMJS2]WGK63487.1 hypothetical protein QAO71_17100 [Halopseudomonas sp. SMJS2]